VVWCGVVWCGVVWCGVVWCGVVWCSMVWCGVIWWGEVGWGGVIWWGGVGWGGVGWVDEGGGRAQGCAGSLTERRTNCIPVISLAKQAAGCSCDGRDSTHQIRPAYQLAISGQLGEIARPWAVIQCEARAHTEDVWAVGRERRGLEPH
jgi:hypothetical protein